MDHLQVLGPPCVAGVQDAAMVGADGEIQITGCFTEQQVHPDRDKSCRRPGVEILVIGKSDVHEAVAFQLSEPLTGVVGGAAEADVPRAVRVDQEPAMIEPRLAHHDRLQDLGYRPRGERPAIADTVEPGPVRDHVTKRHGPDRLRHKIPVAGGHGVPRPRVVQDAPVFDQHAAERGFPELEWDLVPVRQMHHAPEVDAVTDIIDGRGEGSPSASNGPGHDKWRDVGERVVQVDG